MTQRDPPKKPSVPGKDAPGDDLVTAEDLFGDLVDAPHPPRERPSSRPGPIRVRVEDGALTPLPGQGLGGQLAPEVEALLDRLEPVGGRISEPVGGNTPAEPLVPKPTPAAEEAEFAPLDHDEDVLDAERLPPPTSRTGTRFHVAPTRSSEGGDIDLAALAEEAIATEPVRERRERGNWRDDVFGPYQLLDRIAVGGMAEVFKAKRTGAAGFEKTLAVKRILPHLSDNQEFVNMFVDEAKMVAGLSHPNIVQIFDLGQIEDSFFIAMEYVHGRDLRTILKRAKEKELRLPLDLALRIASGLSAALEFAHRKKDERGRPMEIVHRDVSPQNILISFEGDVKLADFGIAKAATKASGTDRGALRGKLLYMSPEQAWGKSLDHRSDLFSLGLVLYEMVTEEKPFLLDHDGSEMTILEKVRRCELVPPRSRNPRIPESLDRVVMKALQKDPEERFQDAVEMNRALERVMRERQPPSASELKRFMELLFDRDEREEAIPDDLFPGTPARPARVLQESGLDEGHGAVPEKTPASDTRPDAELSVDALLRRFGIK
jgi:serine/threonine protein kinase